MQVHEKKLKDKDKSSVYKLNTAIKTIWVKGLSRDYLKKL
jgi:hypothetical protein